MTGHPSADLTSGSASTESRSVVAVTAEDTFRLGRQLGSLLRAGDLVILAGDLGAGKTALAQGIGAGLRVHGVVASPTFVIARVHPGRPPGPAMIHVDAYRLGDSFEFDDLDLDADLARAAVVVEWGAGKAEQLADAHLLVHLTRHLDDSRTIELWGVGGDWAARLNSLEL